MKRFAPIAICTLFALWGCEPMDPSGDPLKPVKETASAPAPAPVATTDAAEDGEDSEDDAPVDGFDFEAEDREDEEVVEDPDLEDLYAGLGIEKRPEQETKPPPKPVPADLPSTLAAAPVRQPWQPGVAIPGSWGVRLVSTVTDAQPPRAILGMPDGSEQVVQPGSMLPTAGVVVLAVGRDAVQLAEITPDGDRAKVSSYVLTALYPGARADQ